MRALLGIVALSCSLALAAACGGKDPVGGADAATGGSGGAAGGQAGASGQGGAAGADAAPTGPCESLGACDCLRASARCRPRAEPCWCPTECYPPGTAVDCICGGGHFLACQNDTLP